MTVFRYKGNEYKSYKLPDGRTLKFKTEDKGWVEPILYESTDPLIKYVFGREQSDFNAKFEEVPGAAQALEYKQDIARYATAQFIDRHLPLAPATINEKELKKTLRFMLNELSQLTIKIPLSVLATISANAGNDTPLVSSKGAVLDVLQMAIDTLKASDLSEVTIHQEDRKSKSTPAS